MNILWIPHYPRKKGFMHRHEHLIERLREKHNIHIIEWDTYGNGLVSITSIPGSLNYSHRYQDGVHYHHIARFYDIKRKLSKEKSKASCLNEVLFQKQVRYIIRRFNIEIMIGGPSSYLIGFPPYDTGIPFIFDYLDCADWSEDTGWKESDITYIKNAAAVISVSRIGYEQVKTYNDTVYYLPNGVNIGYFQNISGEKVRKRLGLIGKKVISLIGITCCPSLYFIDAVGMLSRKRQDIKCLIVGDSVLMPIIRKKVAKYGDSFILTGPIDYSKISGYFAATDIGLYPQGDNPYYQAASPIKIFEYTASGKWIVVSPQLDEVTYFGFPNVIFSKSDVDSLKETITDCLDREPPSMPENIWDYDWQKLANRLEKILYSIVSK